MACCTESTPPAHVRRRGSTSQFMSGALAKHNARPRNALCSRMRCLRRVPFVDAKRQIRRHIRGRCFPVAKSTPATHTRDMEKLTSDGSSSDRSVLSTNSTSPCVVLRITIGRSPYALPTYTCEMGQW